MLLRGGSWAGGTESTPNIPPARWVGGVGGESALGVVRKGKAKPGSSRPRPHRRPESSRPPIAMERTDAAMALPPMVMECTEAAVLELLISRRHKELELLRALRVSTRRLLIERAECPICLTPFSGYPSNAYSPFGCKHAVCVGCSQQMLCSTADNVDLHELSDSALSDPATPNHGGFRGAIMFCSFPGYRCPLCRSPPSPELPLERLLPQLSHWLEAVQHRAPPAIEVSLGSVAVTSPLRALGLMLSQMLTAAAALHLVELPAESISIILASALDMATTQPDETVEPSAVASPAQSADAPGALQADAVEQPFEQSIAVQLLVNRSAANDVRDGLPARAVADTPTPPGQANGGDALANPSETAHGETDVHNEEDGELGQIAPLSALAEAQARILRARLSLRLSMRHT